MNSKPGTAARFATPWGGTARCLPASSVTLQPFAGEPQAMSSPAANRLLRLPQVLERIGLSRSMVYLLESQGRFPGRVKVGTRAVAWPEDEVQAWIDAKKATRCVSTDSETAQTVGRALASWGVHSEVIRGSEIPKPVSTHRTVREGSNPTADRGPQNAAQVLVTPAARAARAAK